MKSTYASLAVHNYHSLYNHLQISSDYGTASMYCAFVIEQMLKSIIEFHCADNDSLQKLIKDDCSVATLCKEVDSIYKIPEAAQQKLAGAHAYADGTSPNLPLVTRAKMIAFRDTVNDFCNWFYANVSLELLHKMCKDSIAISEVAQECYDSTTTDREVLKRFLQISPLPVPKDGPYMFEHNSLPEDFTDD